MNFPCSADQERDWQIYPVDPYSAESGDHINGQGFKGKNCRCFSPGENYVFLVTAYTLLIVTYTEIYDKLSGTTDKPSNKRILSYEDALFFLLSLELCRCSSDLFLSSRPRLPD